MSLAADKRAFDSRVTSCPVQPESRCTTDEQSLVVVYEYNCETDDFEDKCVLSL